jgi:4-amino-4-deoxy-L-arabinose transferase-like glycosyltransferase
MGSGTRMPLGVMSRKEDMSVGRPWVWTAVAVLAVLLGLVLRLDGLTGRGMSHPEVFIPGIELPDIAEPPMRDSLAETVHFHFHIEPHPMGYYLAMFGWTSLFGTDLFSLRLPSVIIGVLTVIAIWRLGARLYNEPLGAVAAVLLALHAFHILWSQVARMYAAGALFAVLATMLLVSMTRERMSAPRAVGYVAVIFCGTQMTELFWIVVFAHIGWTALFVDGPTRPFRWADAFLPWSRKTLPLLQVQALAVLVSIAEISHAAYRARRGAVEEPRSEFLIDYFNFGFLFDNAGLTPNGGLPVLYGAAVAAVCLLLLGLGLSMPSANSRAQSDGRRLPFSLLALAAVLVFAFMLWLAWIARINNQFLLALSVLPILCLWIPSTGSAVSPFVGRFVPFLDRLKHRIDPYVALLFIIAVPPVAALYVLSHEASVLAPRAFLVLVPFLVLLAAAGLVVSARRLPRLVTAGFCIAVAAFWGSAFYFSHGQDFSPRDYKKAAAIIAGQLQPDDLIFVRDRDWADTPMYYHLKNMKYVADGYRAAVSDPSVHRVWIIDWFNDYPGLDFTWDQLRRLQSYDERLETLRENGFHAIDIERARETTVILFAR